MLVWIYSLLLFHIITEQVNLFFLRLWVWTCLLKLVVLYINLISFCKSAPFLSFIIFSINERKQNWSKTFATLSWILVICSSCSSWSHFFRSVPIRKTWNWKTLHHAIGNWALACRLMLVVAKVLYLSNSKS